MNFISRKIAGIVVISALLTASLTAQTTRNDVIKAYNEGAKAVQADLKVAIESFEKVITLSDQVGETANDLKQKAIQVLPGLYVKAANTALTEKKPATDVIRAARRAAAESEKYGNAANKENAEKIMLQAYSSMASGFFGQNDYEKALQAFDSALMINPGYAAAIFNKALIYIRQDKPEEVEKTIDLYLEKLGGTNEELSKQARTTALEYFRADGSKANQAENLDEALVMLNKAAKYGDDKDLFYYFADVYNKKKDFDKGLEFAKKGLEMETGNAEAKAKFYYQLAVAQAGKGQTSDACASFKNALYGPFVEASTAQRKNLKCQ
ncbi:MAG: tetratricopeptide repeat protein [Bacteroidales bacterium]|jgi:tetratricopeptide (TPR) repeat protein|nr:tetratricopeptide repeat protein [Bacteroidales bacterium]OQB60494.1 MAG: Tetratricopeptide repeat protein [Bacteroidetes bacterium ADurb.Bin145]NMD03720.1 tetratricopeptide repeat protein [Bacteroidales bacterium]HOU03031.1 tetratricopeptide repeat protein [Bacteroidales bacterium]HQG57207.1 tetratricopeptide repeat protein [Bacteroidales bacterium]